MIPFTELKGDFWLRKVLGVFGYQTVKSSFQKVFPKKKSVVSQQCPLQASHARSELNPWCFQKMPEMAFLQLPDPSTEIDTKKVTKPPPTSLKLLTQARHRPWVCWEMQTRFHVHWNQIQPIKRKKLESPKVFCHFSNARIRKKKRSWIHHTGLSYQKEIISEPTSRWGVSTYGKIQAGNRSPFICAGRSLHCLWDFVPTGHYPSPEFLPNIFGFFWGIQKQPWNNQWDHKNQWPNVFKEKKNRPKNANRPPNTNPSTNRSSSQDSYLPLKMKPHFSRLHQDALLLLLKFIVPHANFKRRSSSCKNKSRLRPLRSWCAGGEGERGKPLSLW